MTRARSAAACAAACAALALAGCPVGHRAPSPEVAARCAARSADPAELRRYVAALAGELGPRDHEHPGNLDAAAAYVRGALEATGATVTEQVYEAGGQRYRNVLAALGPDTRERIVVGAHYDAAVGTPGADDNASGVAGLLALARLLAADPPPLRVELAAYTLEEPLPDTLDYRRMAEVVSGVACAVDVAARRPGAGAPDGRHAARWARDGPAASATGPSR